MTSEVITPLRGSQCCVDQVDQDWRLSTKHCFVHALFQFGSCLPLVSRIQVEVGRQEGPELRVGPALERSERSHVGSSAVSGCGAASAASLSDWRCRSYLRSPGELARLCLAKDSAGLASSCNLANAICLAGSNRRFVGCLYLPSVYQLGRCVV